MTMQLVSVSLGLQSVSFAALFLNPWPISKQRALRLAYYPPPLLLPDDNLLLQRPDRQRATSLHELA